MNSLYRLCAVKLGAVVINQITDEEISDNLSEFLTPDAASLYPRAVAVNLSDIRVKFTTEMVKTILATIPLTGYSLASGSCVLYFAKYVSGGGIDAAGCITFTLAAGIAVWRTVSADINSLASVTVEVVGVSADGATTPVTPATGVALPTTTAAEMYTIGTTSAASSGVQSGSIDTGIDLEARRGDGDAYNTFAAISAIRPRVRWSQKTVTGPGATIGITTLTLKSVTAGGYRGVTPITFTFAQGMAAPRRIGGNDVSQEYEMALTYNGTNAPVVITGIT